MTLRIGQTIYGYCEGEFGRESYGNKRVEAIGADWVVVRYIDGICEGEPDFLVCAPENLLKYTEKPNKYGIYPKDKNYEEYPDEEDEN